MSNKKATREQIENAVVGTVALFTWPKLWDGDEGPTRAGIKQASGRWEYTGKVGGYDVAYVPQDATIIFTPEPEPEVEPEVEPDAE